MERVTQKKETREEYEARKARRDEQEEKRKEEVKSMANAMMKANQCPECKKAQLRRFRRKNYPFGRKSKPTITKGRKCPNCDYMKINTK